MTIIMFCQSQDVNCVLMKSVCSLIIDFLLAFLPDVKSNDQQEFVLLTTKLH